MLGLKFYRSKVCLTSESNVRLLQSIMVGKKWQSACIIMRNRKFETIDKLELLPCQHKVLITSIHPLGILRIFFSGQKISRFPVDNFPLAESVFITLSLLLLQKTIEKDQLVKKTFGIMYYKLQIK